MRKIIVIGGGPAGMLAAWTAATRGNSVILLEKNEKLGKKLYITGKGRCNVTNNCLNDEFLSNIVTNGKFLYGALSAFSPSDLMDFFVKRGCPLKTERGNRVFPESDKSSDIIKTLAKSLEKAGVDVRLNSKVSGIKISGGRVVGVETNSGYLPCDSAIVCTGGVSYPATGSTGDGYAFAKSGGHLVVTPKPSLTGIELCGNDYKPLQGVSLKNVAITVKKGEKTVYNDFGEMLFTHYGVSGPIILSASCLINGTDCDKLTLNIDLKPALTADTLDRRIIKELEAARLKSVRSAVRTLVPQALTDVILSRANINPDKKCSSVTKEERGNLFKTLKNLSFKVSRLRPLEEAIVTSGGVSVKEINPKTMESKLIKGLFFAGEVIDVDAFTGGFNVQIAFSTGFVAGNNA